MKKETDWLTKLAMEENGRKLDGMDLSNPDYVQLLNDGLNDIFACTGLLWEYTSMSKREELLSIMHALNVKLISLPKTCRLTT